MALYGKQSTNEQQKLLLLKRFLTPFATRQMLNEHSEKLCCYEHCVTIRILFNCTVFTGINFQIFFLCWSAYFFTSFFFFSKKREVMSKLFATLNFHRASENRINKIRFYGFIVLMQMKMEMCNQNLIVSRQQLPLNISIFSTFSSSFTAPVGWTHWLDGWLTDWLTDIATKKIGNSCYHFTGQPIIWIFIYRSSSWKVIYIMSLSVVQFWRISINGILCIRFSMQRISSIRGT